jgi:archaellum component FlaC
MATPPFVFGAGANYAFGGTAPPSLQEQLRRLQVEKAGLENKLDGELYRNRKLGSQRDTAVKEAAVARDALKQARATWAIPPPDTNMADTDEKQTRINELENEVAGLKRKQEHDTATIEGYQHEVARYENSVKDLKSKLRTENDKAEATERQYAVERDGAADSIAQSAEQIRQLEATAQKLRDDVDHHKVAAADNLSLFHRAMADTQHVKDALDAALQAKDALEEQKVKVELEHADLLAQWHEAQAQLEEHAESEAQFADYRLDHENMLADYERQNNATADTDRTIIVKDLRIQELEQQLQREKQRNMNDADAADEANIAAATSPLHETPPAHSVFSDSLEDELNGDYDGYDYIDHEPVELALSNITETSTAPVEPAYPTLDFYLNAPVSVTPVEPVRPELAVYTYEAVSVPPKDAVAPTLTRSVNEVGSVTPVEPLHPELAFYMNEPVSTAPKDAVAPMLSLSINEVGSVVAQDIVPPMLTFSDNTTILDCSPVAPAAPIATPMATTSTQTQAPQLTYRVVDSASTAVAPIAPALNLSTSQITLLHEDIPVEALPAPAMATTPIVVTYEEVPVEASLADSLASSPVMVTHEEAPLEVIPALDLPKSSKANGTAFPTAPITQVARPTWFTSLRGLLHALLPFFTIGLMLLSLYLYSELDAWRTANGVGYYGNGGQYRRGDAYGNGIYFGGFSFIPLTKDEGGNIGSELVAHTMSMVITGIITGIEASRLVVLFSIDGLTSLIA